MKKIFTLLVLSTAMLSTAFAQYGKKDKSNDVYVSIDKSFDKHDNDFGYGKGAYIFTAR